MNSNTEKLIEALNRLHASAQPIVAEAAIHGEEGAENAVAALDDAADLLREIGIGRVAPVTLAAQLHAVADELQRRDTAGKFSMLPPFERDALQRLWALARLIGDNAEQSPADFGEPAEHDAAEARPACGHSACVQHWIDTGAGVCVKEEEADDLAPRVVVTVDDAGHVEVYASGHVVARIVSRGLVSADDAGARVIPYSDTAGPGEEPDDPVLGFVNDADVGIDADFVARVFDLESSDHA